MQFSNTLISTDISLTPNARVFQHLNKLFSESSRTHNTMIISRIRYDDNNNPTIPNNSNRYSVLFHLQLREELKTAGFEIQWFKTAVAL